MGQRMKSLANRVLCEIDPATKKIIRILRRGGAALFLRPEQVIELPKIEAVGQIRKVVFEQSHGECRNCGKCLTWNFHMHEQQPRGAGGEISIWNSVALCAECHLNQEHGNRKPQWSIRK